MHLHPHLISQLARREKGRAMRMGMVLTAAGALLAAVAIAACGSTSTANQVPASTAASGNTSSTRQPNSAYPYEPKGVTYNGEGAQVDTFSIPAGTYSLNQHASYDPANDPNGMGTCEFGGELDYLSGSGGPFPLGNNGVPIGAMSPINGPATVASYAAGNYRLDIVPGTTCSWTVELWP